MSDTEGVCVEVRELAEPALAKEEDIDDTPTANKLGDETPIEAQAGSVKVQNEYVPTVVQNKNVNVTPECNLRHSVKRRRKGKGKSPLNSQRQIEDLKIYVQEDESVVLGKITSVVKEMVVVDSLPGSQPIDIDSVLFLEKGTKPLGHVFDVLGSVGNPMYCVRFNSNQEIQEKGIAIGSLVYIAPRTEHTKFVNVSELMKEKGRDETWISNSKVEIIRDFSDDRKESEALRLRRTSANEQNVTLLQNQHNQRNSHNSAPRRGRYRRRRRGHGRGNFNRGG